MLGPIRVLVLAGLAGVATSLQAAGITFPGKKVSRSPDGQIEIRSIEGPGKDGEPEHRLILHDAATGKDTWIFTTGRYCEVLWDPSGTRLAITDWAGSNVADIFVADAKTHAVDLMPNCGISAYLQAEEKQGHLYWEALMWNGPSVLVIRVFGHTDEAHGHGFTYKFQVDLDSNKATLIQRTLTEKSD